MKVVVVESPAKAKTINKYLGDGYKVLASVGHIRDLPRKDGSVDPDRDFAMKWEVSARSNTPIGDIRSALKGATKLILATDPDREGEAISWHVLEVMNEKKAIGSMPVERVVFNEITRSLPSSLVTMASTDQYSSALKASISASRSQISLRATDWTRPAERAPGSLRHSRGEIPNPPRYSSARRAR